MPIPKFKDVMAIYVDAFEVEDWIDVAFKIGERLLIAAGFHLGWLKIHSHLCLIISLVFTTLIGYSLGLWVYVILNSITKISSKSLTIRTAPLFIVSLASMWGVAEFINKITVKLAEATGGISPG